MREDRGQRTILTDLYDELSAFLPDRVVPLVHQRHDGLLQGRHLGYGVGVKDGWMKQLYWRIKKKQD